MKIYTKGGDTGETSLFGGNRVPKDDLRICTYGTFDELNAFLGTALAEPGMPEELADRLLKIQHELFQLGAELATPRGKSTGIELISDAETERLESEIDAMETALEPLKTFILPGGSRLAGLLHQARTISRRAERELVTLHRAEPQRPELVRYVNRLSDYLFVAARFANRSLNVSDIPWQAKRPSRA